MPEVSVVMPCYRAEGAIGRSIAQLMPVLQGEFRSSEILVVDDGSDDATAEVAQGAADRCRSDGADRVGVRVIALPENGGKGAAVRAGMAEARGELCIFADADLAFGIEGLVGVLDALKQGAPVAVASRLVAGSTVLVPSEHVSTLLRRHLASRTLNFLVRVFFGVRTRDTQAGLKGFRRPVADAIFPVLRTRRFGFDTEIFALLSRAGVRPVEVPVRYRFGGKTSSVRLLRDGFLTLRDLCALRLRLWFGRYRATLAALRALAPAAAAGAADS